MLKVDTLKTWIGRAWSEGYLTSSSDALAHTATSTSVPNLTNLTQSSSHLSSASHNACSSTASSNIITNSIDNIETQLVACSNDSNLNRLNNRNLT
jgi:hypothetical protein